MKARYGFERVPSEVVDLRSVLKDLKEGRNSLRVAGPAEVRNGIAAVAKARVANGCDNRRDGPIAGCSEGTAKLAFATSIRGVEKSPQSGRP